MRALAAALDEVQLLAHTRRPSFVIEVYDVRSTASDISPTRIGDVVLFNLGLSGGFPSIVGPRDFTGDVSVVEVSETAGDYADAGIAASQIILTVHDSGELDPLENPPTPGELEADGRWLRQGNVILIREGDLAVDQSLWPTTFVGTLVGQPGRDRNRTTGRSSLTCKAVSREQDFLKLENTSINFVQGTTYQSIAETIAETDMGLALEEIALPTFSSRVTTFDSTQFVSESPLVSLARVMFLDGFLPRFLGDGRLGASPASITQAPARIYSDPTLPVSVVRPFTSESGINEVEIIGLSPDMSQVIQVRQTLARANVSTGFFTRDISIPVQWSRDGTQQALNVRLEVDASVGDALFAIGGESFTSYPSAIDGGSTRGLIEIDGNYNPTLVGLVLVSIIAAGFIPDIAPPFGGATIPIGRVVESALTSAAMSILGSQALGQYRVTGQPYEYVFQELRSVARKSGLLSHEIRPMRIENHLINTQGDADVVAERVYRRERAKQNARTISMVHDLALEPGDVFEIGDGSSARRYFVASIQRRLERAGQHMATLSCFEVTSGVLP